MVSEATLNEAPRRLVERFHPAAIILFGSQAKGTADDRSDVDLLIVYPLKPGEDRAAVWLEVERSLRGLRHGRDVVLMTPEEYERLRQIPGTVAVYADEEGKVLYARAA